MTTVGMPEIKNNSVTRFCAEVPRVPTWLIATALDRRRLSRLDNFFSYPTYNGRWVHLYRVWSAGTPPRRLNQPLGNCDHSSGSLYRYCLFVVGRAARQRGLRLSLD